MNFHLFLAFSALMAFIIYLFFFLFAQPWPVLLFSLYHNFNSFLFSFHLSPWMLSFSVICCNFSVIFLCIFYKWDISILCILIGSKRLRLIQNCVVACTIYYGSSMPQSPLILTQALLASPGQFYLLFFPLAFSGRAEGSLVLSLLGSLGSLVWCWGLEKQETGSECCEPSLQ